MDERHPDKPEGDLMRAELPDITAPVWEFGQPPPKRVTWLVRSDVLREWIPIGSE